MGRGAEKTGVQPLEPDWLWAPPSSSTQSNSVFACPRGVRNEIIQIIQHSHFQTKPNVHLNIQIIEKECGFGAGRQGALEVLETLFQRSMRSDGR